MSIGPAGPITTNLHAMDLIARFRALDARIAEAEAERARLIGEVNTDADAEVNPLIEDREAIRRLLEAWWPSVADELTQGKRKTVELGGVMIGTRTGRDTLGIEDDAKALASLAKADWGKPFLRVTTAIDKAAVLKALDGEYGAELKRRGFSRKAGEEAFVLEPVKQAGTQADVR